MANQEVVAETIEEKSLRWLKNPWMLSQKPFRIVENVYFVGTNWVSIFLIDTKEGLVLIDCAMQENLYQTVDSIRALGFDPHKIKKLFLTHGHFDHCGAARAIQEMSDCEIWMGKEEEFFFTQRRDLIVFEERVPEFRIDHFYDYNTPLDLGNIKIEFVHCPGHTPGTTSIFFDVMHEGQNLTCAVHGGLGSGVLKKEMLAKQGMPLSLREEYCNSIDKVIDRKVDVVLPSHAGHCVDHNFFAIAQQDDGAGNGFIDPHAWRRMLTHKKAEIMEMIEKDI